MADNRTEQATPRRREKARERGQVARSRDLPAALVLLAAGMMVGWQLHQLPRNFQEFLSSGLAHAATDPLAPAQVLSASLALSLRWAAPALVLCWVVACASLSVQGGLVFAPAALTPDWNRFNPASNIAQMFSLTGLTRLLKTLLPAGVLLYLGAATLVREWGAITLSVTQGYRATYAWLAGLAFELTWKAGLVLLMWAAADYFAQRLQLDRQLRMSKEEIREETKETEGHPMIRMRIRRIQRQMRRRSMMRDVQRATVILTNPTEFAVALRYEPALMDAPVVLAKGRGILAQQMRSLGVWHGIPIVENPPLTRLLYRTVQIGQAIPAKLYAAIAEILAFIYRAHTRVQSQAAREAGSGV